MLRDKRFSLAMGKQVIVQMDVLTERLGTILAGEELLFGVNEYVFFQVVLQDE